MNVKVLSKKVIKPSNPTPNDLGKLNLSLFDQLSPHMHFHIIFYYFGDSRNESAKRNSQLEKSLSHTLNIFYPLAGRYSQKHVSIDCQDQGIEWFEARVNGKLAEFLEKPKIEQLVDEFLPWKSFPPAANLTTTPLLGIQINTFDCGGMVLGMSISHTIADGNTIFRRFIAEWAMNNRTGIHPRHGDGVAYENTADHCYNQFASLFPARASHDDSLSDTYLIPEEDCEFVSKRLFFSDKTISNIREEFASLFNYKPSRVVVVMALMWKSLMVASGAKHGGQIRNSTLALAMDFRGKQSLQLPCELNYGNFWMLVPVSFLARDQAEMELQNLIALIGNTIRETKQKLANAGSSDEISSMFINNRREIVRKAKESKDWDTYFFSSWCNFPLFEVDFGWGLPSWVSTATTQKFPITWLMDAKNCVGIDAWVNLKERDILQLETKLLEE